MAFAINRTLRDDDSRATFEIVQIAAEAVDSIIVDSSELTGSGGAGGELVRVIKVTALVCDNSGDGGNITLEWDDGTTETTFLTLPVGHTSINIPFTPPTDTYSTSTDINVLNSGTNISFTLRLIIEKFRGFDYSLVNRI